MNRDRLHYLRNALAGEDFNDEMLKDLAQALKELEQRQEADAENSFEDVIRQYRTPRETIGLCLK